MVVVAVIFGLPETPRYLIQRGRIEEATSVLANLWDLPVTHTVVQSEIEDIRKAKALDNGDGRKRSRFLQKDSVQTRWRLFLSCLLLFMNQVRESLRRVVELVRY